jgi:hypothetical protein
MNELAQKYPNYSVFDLQFLLSFSRRTSHREYVLGLAGSLLSFLQEHNLLRRVIGYPDEEIPAELHIVLSDLTEAGQYLVTSGAFDRWLGACDRNGHARSTRILERALHEYESQAHDDSEKP